MQASCLAAVSSEGMQLLVTFHSQAMDDLGLKRYCCRRMILTHVDLIEQLLQYKSKSRVASCIACPWTARTISHSHVPQLSPCVDKPLPVLQQLHPRQTSKALVIVSSSRAASLVHRIADCDSSMLRLEAARMPPQELHPAHTVRCPGFIGQNCTLWG